MQGAPRPVQVQALPAAPCWAAASSSGACPAWAYQAVGTLHVHVTSIIDIGCRALQAPKGSRAA